MKPEQPAPDQLRAQPFTMEHWGLSLPDVDATAETAHGPLDEGEQRQLVEAHKAVDNARTARWMLGYALEVVRRRRLYRGDGTRTFEQYLDQEHDGMSTSEADRLQKTWRLAQTVQKELGRPLPDSHLHKLRPYAESTSDDEAARAYVALYWAHQNNGVRLVADQVQTKVKEAIAAAHGVADPAARSQAVSSAWTTALMPAPREEATPRSRVEETPSTDPVEAALQALAAARKAIEDAVEDKKARAARSPKTAAEQQNDIRRIGRILAKIKVEGDGTVAAEDDDGLDAEIVDAEIVPNRD
ncbi:hypothetical protein [Streptomyces sp. BH105]|uniref:hypothetical protein n=1 Tax=Streptomyces sp. BH105 TaxID=3410408 RepID=UPI003CF3D4D5